MKWTKPIKLENLEFELNQKGKDEDFPGLYCWGFDFDGKFYYYYLGKSWYVKWRILEHVAHLKGGLYTVLNLTEIDSSKHLTEQSENGLLPYKPDSYSNVKAFQTNSLVEQEKVNSCLEGMLTRFRVSTLNLTDYFNKHSEYEAKDLLRSAELKMIDVLEMKKRRKGVQGGRMPIELLPDRINNLLKIKCERWI